MPLLEPYLPPTTDAEGADASPVATTGGYAEGGSLYALGLIHDHMLDHQPPSVRKQTLS